MIVVFPMLTDESISPNIIPGICKSLEKFILIYELDSIMKITGLTILSTGAKIAGAMAMAAKTKNESVNLLEIDPLVGAPPPKPGYQNPKQSVKDEKTYPGKVAIGAMNDLKKMGTVEVEMPKDQALSVEPTYMIVNTTIGSRIIGVKVIPFPVKTNDNYSLADHLAADASLNFMDSLVYSISRKTIRAFWSLCRGLRIPFLKDRVITGDPISDILWASTFHKRFVFCLLNFSEIKNGDFFKNAGGIHKLHDMGWNSFILADDINKRAIFCMKEFHGLCSSVPYQFIYSTLGKEHKRAYDSLENVKKSASPFFKLSTSVKQVFGESVKVLDSYLKRIS